MDASRTPQVTTDLFEAMRTLRAVRRFQSVPIPLSIVRQIIAAATHAPSARNVQPWYFIAVRDSAMKQAIAAPYQRAWQAARGFIAATDADADIKDRPGYTKMMQRVDQLAGHLADVPMIILACLDTEQLGPMADATGHILAPQSAYASIFPAVQNLMLAARALGIGSTLTTLHAAVETEIRAAVAIPASIHIAALIPLGYPTPRFRPTRRKSVDEVAFLDRWNQPLRSD